MSECIFCEIVAKKIPTMLIKETDDIVVIKDIAPKAPVHYLIIPKKHIQDVQSLDEMDHALAGKLIMTARQLHNDLNTGDFRLQVNSGKNAGQIVPHLHLHFLAGALKETNL